MIELRTKFKLGETCRGLGLRLQDLGFSVNLGWGDL